MASKVKKVIKKKVIKSKKPIKKISTKVKSKINAKKTLENLLGSGIYPSCLWMPPAQDVLNECLSYYWTQEELDLLYKELVECFKDPNDRYLLIKNESVNPVKYKTLKWLLNDQGYIVYDIGERIEIKINWHYKRASVW